MLLHIAWLNYADNRRQVWASLHAPKRHSKKSRLAFDLTSRVDEVCSDTPTFLVSLAAIAKHLGAAHGQVTLPSYRSCRNCDD